MHEIKMLQEYLQNNKPQPERLKNGIVPHKLKHFKLQCYSNIFNPTSDEGINGYHSYMMLYKINSTANGFIIQIVNFRKKH